MKQILITIAMLSIALALVIGVMVPLLTHGAETGDDAVLKGDAVITRIGHVLK
jgi:hypothetical protein